MVPRDGTLKYHTGAGLISEIINLLNIVSLSVRFFQGKMLDSTETLLFIVI